MTESHGRRSSIKGLRAVGEAAHFKTEMRSPRFSSALFKNEMAFTGISR